MMFMKVSMAEDIIAYLKDNQSSMEGFLKNLVALESPSKDPASQDELFQLLGKTLNDLDFHTIRMFGDKTGGFLYARPRLRDKNKKLQLLIGHCDTVWDKNTLQKMPIKNLEGKLTGPGVYDMKAGLTQLIFALRAISELHIEVPLAPVVLINSDEEIGSVESGHTIERLAKISSRAYVMEPPLGLDGKLKTARKGIGRFAITVEGKAAHAGLDPGKGANAIVELSQLVQQLYAMNDLQKGISVNVGMIQGGISPNVVAPQSKAVVDVRVANMEDGKYITDKIHGLKPVSAEVTLHIDGGIGRPPMERTSRNQALWRLAKTQAGVLGIPLEEATAGGGSDGNTTSMYTATLDGLGTTGDGAHALHEHILTDHLFERTALLTLMIMADEVLDEKTEAS